MCFGATSGQKVVAGEAGSAYGTAINQAKQVFGDTSTAFNDIMSSVGPIDKAGPGQLGLTAAQLGAENAATVDQSAAIFKNAKQATGENIAAQGGGNIALPSGVNAATETNLAAAGANEEATALRSNYQQDVALGNQNWKTAEGLTESAPGMFATSNTAEQAATNAGEQAMSDQNALAAAPSWGKLAYSALNAAVEVGQNASEGGIAKLLA